MKRLISLPTNAAESFHEVTGLSQNKYFCTSDPEGMKLGSGGGTVWLLDACKRKESAHSNWEEWLSKEKRILLHAGGQSRRLPAYAPSGKVLTPIPVFRWARGQRIDQSLLDLQLPLYESILKKAPEGLHTLIASGDVFLRTTEPLQEIPDADVVCYGLWADSELASHHGMFLMNRNNPNELDFMLQKPDTETQARLMQTHFSLMDIGIWLLSDRAVMKLCTKFAQLQGKSSVIDAFDFSNNATPYCLYSQFGCALGNHPTAPDELLSDLKVAILPLPGGEFYHFGTAPELLTSAEAIQNLVKDQRFIIQKGVKRQSSVFTQNAIISNRPNKSNELVWIENSYITEGWHYSSRNILTGIPNNTWAVNIPEGVCVDIVPIGDSGYALRPYGYYDPFRGNIDREQTIYLGQPISRWLSTRGIDGATLGRTDDLQAAKLFPVSSSLDDLEKLLHWFISDNPSPTISELWCTLPRLSADELSAQANLPRLFAQRSTLQKHNLPKIAENWQRSVFYQVNLKDMARKYAALGIAEPTLLSQDAPHTTKMHDAMFRSELFRNLENEPKAAEYENNAFNLLQNAITEEAIQHKCRPVHTTYSDQIVWGRSPVRIDIAGGWTDTPPYSLLNGGNVVNLAINLNGQPPLQVYIKPCVDPVVVCRSIDLGAMEVITTYDELRLFNKVGSPFSIPKAALSLAGFLPEYCLDNYNSLREQLEAYGCGIEITLLSAIPAGSGLGTSSILAATVLGSLSDFCGLAWDKNEICNRTLMLEQLLTTGGGWQDQYGGVLPGVKLLQTSAGFNQNATARWLPDTLFTHPEYRPCHLLYYTGVTRTAKHILAEIVRGMFLNNTRHLQQLDEMKQHALAMTEAIQLGRFNEYGHLLRATWEQNKALDPGTNPEVIEDICKYVDDLCLGYKLPGAGGGGFMYMVAKDPEAALRIRRLLTNKPAAPNARFVEMSVSNKGLKVSRS